MIGRPLVLCKAPPQVKTDTRSIVYKGWLIRDGFWRLVEFKEILRDGDYFFIRG